MKIMDNTHIDSVESEILKSLEDVVAVFAVCLRVMSSVPGVTGKLMKERPDALKVFGDAQRIVQKARGSLGSDGR